MSSHKERRKARRRAEKQMDGAWEAVRTGNTALAEKMSRRAIDGGFVNPRLWIDRGLILEQCHDYGGAETALRQAIAIAPTFGDAFVQLARLQAGRGKIAAAARLQQRAVELQPDSADAAEALRAYEAMLPGGAAEPGDARAGGAAAPELTERTGRFDWDAVDADLRSRGLALLPELLTAGECADLRATWDEPDRFEHEVVHDREDYGRVAYRFFQPPLPELVASLRTEVFARAAGIANHWNELLGRTDRYPAALDEFLDRCRQAGQYRSTPILLRYVAGGFNAPHRDVAGRVIFPFQLAVTLGPGSSADDGGGELLLLDERPGKKRRERRLATDVGDGVLFCTRERLVEIGGALGLQPVLHGVSEVRAPERYALGVPFHNHG